MMKTMKRNETTLYYCLYEETQSIEDEYGNETGEQKVIYSAPVKMEANISAASGTTQVEQFGNFISYDKVIVTDDMDCPIDENSVLFVDKLPEYDDEQNPLFDYTVKRIAKSLNSISIAISKVTVS